MRRAYEFGLLEGDAYIRDGVVRVEPFVQVENGEPEPPQEHLFLLLSFLCGSVSVGGHIIIWGLQLEILYLFVWVIFSLFVGWRLSNHESD